MKTSLLLILFLFSQVLWAQTVLRYEGYIENSGAPVNAAAQSFSVSIMMQGCATALTSTSAGADIVNGEFNIAPSFSDSILFSQIMNPSYTNGSCPVANTNRIMRIVWNGETFDIPMNDAARSSFSTTASRLGERNQDEFLKIVNNPGQAPLSVAQVSTLVDLISGTNTQYLRPSSTFTGDVTGTASTSVVSRIRGTNVSATAPALNQVLKFDGTNWTPAVDDAGVLSDASYAASGAVRIDTSAAVSGLNITAGVLSMPNVGTAGTYGSASLVPVITTDNKGRVTSVAPTAVNDSTKLSLAGGTMTGAINMGTQNITNATSVAASNFSGRNFVISDNDSNTTTLRTPTDLAANYTLTLPPNDGDAGQILSTDGAGVLSWISSGGGGTVTTVASSNPYLTIANPTTTPTITANVGTAANTLAAGDDARIVGAVQQSAYAADLAPAALCTTAQTPYWNTVSDTWACQNISVVMAGDVTGSTTAAVVSRIRGINVSTSAPMVGQTLKYNGTDYVPSNDDGIAVETDPTVQTWAKAAPNTVFTTAGNLGLTTRVPASAAAPTIGQTGQALRWNNVTTQWDWFTPLTNDSPITLFGQAAPAVSSAGQGRIYFDSTSNTFRVSQNGGAYIDLLSAGGSGDVLNAGNSFGAMMTLGTNDNFSLNLETNNMNRLTILNSGNVGIGTIAPTDNLQVIGSIRSDTIRTDSGNNFAPSFTSTTDMSSGVYFPQNGDVGIATNGSISLVARNTGVAIGHFAPNSRLDISGDFNVRGLSAAPTVATAGQGKIYFSNSDNKFKISESTGLFQDLVTVRFPTDSIPGSSIAIGQNALASQISASTYNNIAIGRNVLDSVTTGNYNVGIGSIGNSGSSPLGNLTSGSRNIALGSGAGSSISTGSNNTFVGHDSGAVSTSSNNTAVGVSSLSNSTGSSNVAMGSLALEQLTTGNENIGLGYFAGSNLNNGSQNILIGSIVANSLVTGTRNIIMGQDVASNLTSGNNNIIIGTSNAVQASTSTISNSLNVGNLIQGNLQSGNESLRITTAGLERVVVLPSGNVGIGTGAPSTRLDVNGPVRLGTDSSTISKVVYCNPTIAVASGIVSPGASINIQSSAASCPGVVSGMVVSCSWASETNDLGRMSWVTVQTNGTDQTNGSIRIRFTNQQVTGTLPAAATTLGLACVASIP